MTTTSSYLEAPRRLRAFVRAHETSLVVLAVLIGAIGGLVVAVMSGLVTVLHSVLFNLPLGDRLSSQPSIDPVRALVVPTIGGLLLGFAFLLLLRVRPAREIDPIEANALYGGRMSFRGSVIVALQTIWSSGVGGSVGLEAGYTQLSSGLAASLGRGFHLRRNDQRIMVGCGAAAAIAGAFSAPLAGAFYAFELVIGGYTPASLTPVGVAAVTGYFVAHAFEPLPLGVGVGTVGDVLGRDLAIAALLGMVAALTGIAIMRGVTLCEALLTKSRLWPPLRPALGGLAVGAMALLTPQVMSSGHGALRFAGIVAMPLAFIAGVFALKAVASIVSLGSGFRGGLFFATLFMGALGGRLFAAGVDIVWPGLNLDPNAYAVIGMSALSASVIGGPLTMSFIALESTGNLWLTTAVLVAVIISTTITRELFGYSFATWRLHLRGETIRSAADIGWIRDLTVGKMMRQDMTTVNAAMPIETFREEFPPGSKTQVVAVDGEGHYAGLALVAEAHAPDLEADKGLAGILRYADVVLHPGMNVQEAIAVFDAAEAESLAVVGGDGDRRPIGLLTEAHAMRRYAEESEQRRREVIGEI
ncbi:CIC family chloride channel protein [Bradyrhizobium japonicum]|jgi:chloride channel protein, CIC family|uniref:chloride channel protein n=1 Tax=Bradyrhizobium TaxID=374 RepID=UPI00036342FB|nr:chloride channel protein [Bradyrhizobium elkanii]MBP2431991.1 CIC family chloride channel protein [Bradyrhizobium elkanii]MCP1734934.1 CIC family chloride channel protein [Bradyrhizobium elkanii]MCS3570273.1 CIC family chloride channel protein [Bradyrhizobium elkanii]MCS3588243.1 CIC family chloride channel protein [Bradyrhizobium elkanii]MCS3617687.1 CIC family chloride channel protein [Bradyrhizobium elkanii]